ncbi:hypothetical protein FRC17_009448 [Serendipita sp. 399]|nr:hypothetical protein FRC17_009448 [Serendipita sp. 399]
MSSQFSRYRSADNACQCNIVSYNLMSACAVCQGGNGPSISDYSSTCVAQTFDNEAIRSSLVADVVLPSWASLQPTGTTWSFSQVSAYANQNNYSSGYYPGYDDRMYVAYILLMTGACLLLFVGISWCCVLGIFWHRQRERSRVYGQIATYYRFGGIPGKQAPFQVQNYTALQSRDQFRYPPTLATQYRPPPLPPPFAQDNLLSPMGAGATAEPTASSSTRGGYADLPQVQETNQNLLTPSVRVTLQEPGEETPSPLIQQSFLPVDPKGKGRAV